MKTKIKNIFGENLDILIEGNSNSNNILIFVHGFGTDKNESYNYFSDFADFFKTDYLIIRFDLSGYGKSGGKDSEFQYQKAAGDVNSIIRYARRNFPDKRINILAHSQGTFIVSLLSPYGIKKTVFTSIVNSNTKFVSRELQKRILSRNGKINKNGITVYPRSHGEIQKIGKDFWRTLENFDPVKYLEELGNKTNLIIFKPKQDEILANRYFDEYKRIKNIQYVEIDGDHTFKNPIQRKNLFMLIKNFLSN